MSGNTSPIFSSVGAIGFTQTILTASADYNGNSPYDAKVFAAGTNGSYVQRLRFKALGTNVATVARIFLNPGSSAHMSSLLTQPGAPTAVASTTGGTLLSGTSVYVAKIVAVDAIGALSLVGTESSTTSVTGPTGSIAWTWTAVSGAVSYRIYTGHNGAGSEAGYWTSSTNSFTQIAMDEGTGWTDGNIGAAGTQPSNNTFYGEVSLPATTLSSTAATIDIDYPMNFALPPSYEIYVGLGTTVAAGWQVSAIAGNY